MSSRVYLPSVGCAQTFKLVCYMNWGIPSMVLYVAVLNNASLLALLYVQRKFPASVLRSVFSSFIKRVRYRRWYLLLAISIAYVTRNAPASLWNKL